MLFLLFVRFLPMIADRGSQRRDAAGRPASSARRRKMEGSTDEREPTYGLIAEFDSPAAILHAAEKVRDAGFRRWDVFSPFPVHGMDKVMGLKNSHVGWFSFIGGVHAVTSAAW